MSRSMLGHQRFKVLMTPGCPANGEGWPQERTCDRTGLRALSLLGGPPPGSGSCWSTWRTTYSKPQRKDAAILENVILGLGQPADPTGGRGHAVKHSSTQVWKTGQNQTRQRTRTTWPATDSDAWPAGFLWFIRMRKACFAPQTMPLHLQGQLDSQELTVSHIVVFLCEPFYRCCGGPV